IRLMRIEIVHPEEERLFLIGVLVKPLQGTRRNVFGVAARIKELIGARQVLVVRGEIMIEMREPPEQRPGTDERSGLVTMAAQDLRKGNDGAVVRKSNPVSPDSVLLRIAAREQR